MKSGNLTRRDFLKLTAAGIGAIAIGGGLLEGCAESSGSNSDVLDKNEYNLLEAIAELIIPTDTWPGGRDAGVANFINIQLQGPYKRFQDIYREGLEAIDRTCIKNFKKTFEQLPQESQTLFLQDMENDRLGGKVWKDGFAGKFFEMLRQHCLQGYYGSPRHGGNKDFLSFRMIGLDMPQIVGQNRYGSSK